MKLNEPLPYIGRPNPGRAWVQTYAQLRRSQTHGYRSGLALQKHMDATHGGVFTPTCPACIEVERKTREARIG